jgi:OmpA-OmpF porin, OOP family
MKKLFASLFAICLLSLHGFAQNSHIRPKSLGVSFVMNDFATAQRIRTGSMETVLREKQWGKFKDMSPGLALTYFQGLASHVDFAGSMIISYVSYPIPNKPPTTTDALLLEADASVNLKLVTDHYWVTPYLSAGLGASRYKGYYGAILPLGAGFKVNLFDEAAVFMNAQYRVGVTIETTASHFVYSIGVAGVLGK